MRRNFKRLTILSLAPTLTGSAISALAFQSNAWASSAYSCNNDGSLFFKGVLHSSSATGAQAVFTHYDPYLCSGTTTGDTSSFVWTMLANTAGGPNDDFSQEGWAKIYQWGTQPYWFWECNDCTYTGGGSAPKTAQQYFPANGVPGASNTKLTDRFTTYIDGQGQIHMNIDPVNDPNTTSQYATLVPHGWAPNEQIWSGEIHDTQTQIAGDNNADELITGVEYLNGGTWTNYNISPSTPRPQPEDPSAGWLWGGNNSLVIWDTRYPN